MAITQTGLTNERACRTTEHLAISCGSNKPTKEQSDRVNREVGEEMKRLELNEVVEGWGEK